MYTSPASTPLIIAYFFPLTEHRFGLQLAVAAGATVIATSSSNEKLEIAAKHGAKHLINYREVPAWDEEVRRFGLQLAVAAGATVIATSSSNEKLEIAAKHGAKHLINYREVPAWDEEVRRIVSPPPVVFHIICESTVSASQTNGRGVDHIIEVGGHGTLGKSINAARIGGSIHIIGFISQVSLCCISFF